jgi:signal transduction histidine kinase
MLMLPRGCPAKVSAEDKMSLAKPILNEVLAAPSAQWPARDNHTAVSFDVSDIKKMEQALQSANDELETRVEERTAQLAKKNRQVLKQAEILKMRNENLCELSARLLQAQDEERRRIARDLHDSTGQTLALLSMNLAALEKRIGKANPEVARAISENSQIVREISSELRTLSYLLHPPLLDEMGLVAALRWYVQGFEQRSAVKTTLDVPRQVGRLARSLELAIFRVVQECLINVHRHSGSPKATIRLYRTPEKVTLEVQDEGKGIAPKHLRRIASFAAPGVGLRGMRERVKDFGGFGNRLNRKRDSHQVGCSFGDHFTRIA